MMADLRLPLALDGTDVFVGGVADVLTETTADDTHGAGDRRRGSVFRETDDRGVDRVVREVLREDWIIRRCVHRSLVMHRRILWQQFNALHLFIVP